MSAHRGRHRSRSGYGSIVLLLGLLVSALALSVPGAYGGYLAKITNNADTAGTATYFTCTNAVVGESGTKALFAYPFGEAAGPTAADVTGNNAPGTYGTGITYGVANTGPGGVCPRDGKTVVSLNGTSGYILGPTAKTSTAPNTFSEEIWFKTLTKQGKLIGFGSNRTAGASTTYDRHLYIDTSGRLVFGVGLYTTINSGSSVADGTWHHAVSTLSPAGMALYLDSALVASNTLVTTGTGYVNGGYWRVGYDGLLLWPGAGSGYVNGQLAYAAVYGYALTAAQVAAHYVAGD